MTSDPSPSSYEANEPLQWLEARAAEQMDRLLESDDRTADFHNGAAIDPEVYRRHLLEDVLRIRLNNVVDSMALAAMIETDPVAHSLLKYLYEEYGHDELLAQDLQSMGLGPAEIRDARPLFSTELLVGYLEYTIRREGPLVAIVWDWLVEWYSARYNEAITDAAEASMGRDAVEQTRKHLEIDQQLEHESAISHALELMLERDTFWDDVRVELDDLQDWLNNGGAEVNSLVTTCPGSFTRLSQLELVALWGIAA